MAKVGTSQQGTYDEGILLAHFLITRQTLEYFKEREDKLAYRSVKYDLEDRVCIRRGEWEN